MKLKKLQSISEEQISSAFKNNDLKVFTDPAQLHLTLRDLMLDNSVLLLMSSGNYGGLDFEEVKTWVNK